MLKKIALPFALAAAATITLSSCGSDEVADKAKDAGSSATEAASSATSSAAAKASEASSSASNAATSATDAAKGALGEGLTLKDGWTRASGDKKMTGLFGMLSNSTDKDIVLTSGTSEVAGMIELHETKMVDGEMKMQMAKDGFTIPAGGTFELKPGANHIMLMQLKNEVKAGDKVELKVSTGDGTSFTLETPVREAKAGDEPYHSGSKTESHDH